MVRFCFSSIQLRGRSMTAFCFAASRGALNFALRSGMARLPCHPARTGTGASRSVSVVVEVFSTVNMQRSFSARARVGIVTFVAVGALALGSIWFINKYFGIEARAFEERLWPPPTAEQVEMRRLRKIAGWFSVDCGHVPRHRDANQAIACAQRALRDRRRFYVAFDYVGIDSHGTTGIAAGRAGTIYEVSTDEMFGDEFGQITTNAVERHVDVNRCEGRPFERTEGGNRYLTCRVTAGKE
jgi:hypothetical protein